MVLGPIPLMVGGLAGNNGSVRRKAMRYLEIIPASLLMLFLGCAICHAKASTVDLYTNAVMTGDVAALEKLLAPNYFNIASNGHIRDKEHFIQSIRDKSLVVERLSLTNVRESKVGNTILLTANGVFHGKTTSSHPQGTMRFTMVIADNNGEEQVALFQATPVVATKDCADGNCQLK